MRLSFSLFAFSLAVVVAACADDARPGPTALLLAPDTEVAQRSAQQCENVRGTGIGNVFADVQFTGHKAGDLLHGATGSAWAPPEITPRGPSIHLVTYHMIEKGDMTLFTADRGVAAPVDPPLYRLNIRYEILPEMSDGYSGFVQVHGDLVISLMDPPDEPVYNGYLNGHWEVRYTGRICAP
jgi:hypothetical protein